MFPFPYTVYVHTRTPGTVDDYGDPVDVYTPPEDEDGTEVKAFWAVGFLTPGGNAEPPLAGHDRVVVDVDLFVPKDSVIGPHDLVDVGGKQYEVIGEPDDYNNGPFGFNNNPLRVRLRRVDG